MSSKRPARHPCHDNVQLAPGSAALGPPALRGRRASDRQDVGNAGRAGAEPGQAPIQRACYAAARSIPLAFSPNTKKPLSGLFCIWWRRRELNPRPSALCLPVYMFRPFFSVNPSAVRRPGSIGRVHFDLTLCPRTRYSTRGSVIYCATHPEPSKLCSLTFKRLERSFRRWQLC